MALTAQQVLDTAATHNGKITPGRNYTENPEGLGLIDRSLAGLIVVGTMVNPDFFGSREVVTPSGGVWTLPANSVGVYLIRKTTTGDNVKVVDIDRPNDAFGKPSVYQLGRTLESAAGDPGTSEQLTMFHVAGPVILATLADTVDARWPDHMEELLALEVALHMNAKDGRLEESAALIQRRDSWLAVYISMLERYILNKQRTFVRRLGNFVQPHQILAGGSTVRLPEG